MRRLISGTTVAIFLCVLGLTAGSPAAADIVVDAGRGPVVVYVPDSYDPAEPTPLIGLLHGYDSNGPWQVGYYAFPPMSEAYGFIYFVPEGTIDPSGSRFWNATDACCDFYDSGVDDAGYLMALVAEIRAQLTIDPRRIHFAGLSNGAFMAYRLACEHANVVASIACQAGATFDDPVDCDPYGAVHVLHIHGTADNVIHYGGGELFGRSYPGAAASVQQWAGFDGCENVAVPIYPPLDLDTSIPGAETDVFRYDTACDLNGSTELWRILGGAHVPPLTDQFAPLMVEWLLAHPKDDITGVEDVMVTTPTAAMSVQAAPNPFNPMTTITCRIANAGRASLEIVDLRGRHVITLVDEHRPAGEHSVTWNGRNDRGVEMPSGVYLSRLQAGGAVVHGRLTLIR